LADLPELLATFDPSKDTVYWDLEVDANKRRETVEKLTKSPIFVG
jgi:hypothetical protein